MLINRTAMIDYVDARIAKTGNPKHIELLMPPASREEIRAFYLERQALGQLYFQFDIDRLTVADDIIIESYSVVTGARPPADEEIPADHPAALVGWHTGPVGLGRGRSEGCGLDSWLQP